MDNFLGIGLPELFFIAVIALIILGPERLPSTLRQVAKAWGYVRNLGRELTSQFSDEFKALEDLDPRKILNEMADEELAKDLNIKLPGKKPTATTKPTTNAVAKSTATPAKATTTTTKSTTSTTSTSTTSTGAKKTTSKPATPKPAATNPETSTEAAATNAESPVLDTTGATPAEPGAPEPQDGAEPTILPPKPAAPEAPAAASPNGEPPAERNAVVNSATVSVNGASNPAESVA
jgi:sec-independent protein translocase protein TatB